MTTNPYRKCPIVGEYNIEEGLHKAIKLNPSKTYYIQVSLAAKAYHNVKTVVQSKVSGMKGLHATIANLRLQYSLRWGVDPDSVEVVKG
jgi:hypothetical protein